LGGNPLNANTPTSGDESVDEQFESDVELAVQDLTRRTLAAFDSQMGRLVYLSSTRDYNSGTYYHDGLAMRFQPAVAQAALMRCHRSAVTAILELPLHDLVDDLDRYLTSTAEERNKALGSWQKLRAYQMLVPADLDELSVDLFLSNLKVALSVLRLRMKAGDGSAEGS
jgi:hypothetical protein